MTGQVTVIAYHRAKPGKEQELREALLSLCAPTRRERLHQLRSSPIFGRSKPTPFPRKLGKQGRSRRPPRFPSYRRLSLSRVTFWPSRRNSRSGDNSNKSASEWICQMLRVSGSPTGIASLFDL